MNKCTPYNHIYREFRNQFADEIEDEVDTPTCSFNLKFMNEEKSFKAHGLFLSFRSEFFKRFLSRYRLAERMNEIELDEDLFVLVKTYCEMLYDSGVVERVLKNEFEICEKVRELTSKSYQDSMIWKQHYDYYYSTHLKDLFESVVSDSSISKKSSDISVTIQDPTNGNEKTYHLHKLFLKRCPHIVTILNSGMIESQTNHLTFDTISIENFELVLNYIYTNTFKPNQTNAVEIYLFSALLELNSLREVTRTFIELNLSKEDPMFAYSLLSIPEFRIDQNIRHACVQILKKHITPDNAFNLAACADSIDYQDKNFVTRLASVLADQFDLIKDKFFDLPVVLREQTQQQFKKKVRK